MRRFKRRVSRVGALPGDLAIQSNQLLPVGYKNVLFGNGNGYGYEPTHTTFFFVHKELQACPPLKW